MSCRPRLVSLVFVVPFPAEILRVLRAHRGPDLRAFVTESFVFFVSFVAEILRVVRVLRG
jgi:hypothetical protein